MLKDLVFIIAETLAAEGIPEKSAVSHGVTIASRLHDRWAGQQVYIPIAKAKGVTDETLAKVRQAILGTADDAAQTKPFQSGPNAEVERRFRELLSKHAPEIHRLVNRYRADASEDRKTVAEQATEASPIERLVMDEKRWKRFLDEVEKEEGQDLKVPSTFTGIQAPFEGFVKRIVPPVAQFTLRSPHGEEVCFSVRPGESAIDLALAYRKAVMAFRTGKRLVESEQPNEHVD